MKLTRIACLFVILVLLSGTPATSGQQDPTRAVDFAGSYANLRPEQKRLIDDWFQRFSAVVKKPVAPAEGYNNTPLSTKTTFNGVTHALLLSKLTDESGKPLAATALDLVDKIDSVAGEVLGGKGDHQYRIYVQLKPGALELLNRSQEFSRKADNTVFHKGYPICFRSDSGTPSIQISLTRDGTRADIDVDYRSSKFPAALLNGHLTAANSDVRVGNNDERHNQQWSGLQNWWRNVLGLSIFAGSPPDSGGVISTEPKSKADKPAEAIYDFLNTWLVEQKPNEAVAYIADSSYVCTEIETGTPADRGMAKFSLLQGMLGVNQRLGKVASLADVSVGVVLADPTNERLRITQQPHHGQFVLYDVREDLAENFKCANRLDPSQISDKAMKSKSFGKYVGAIFRLRAKNETGQIVASLWQKEGGYWKLVSYDIDPVFDGSRVPNVGAPIVAGASLTYVAGDKDMVKAASDFMNQWLVKRNIEKAAGYISPEAFSCIRVYAEDAKAASTPAEARALLVTGLTRAAEATRSAKTLKEAMVAAQPHNENIRMVKHKDEEAFAVVSVPDSMGDAANCEKRGPDGEPIFSGVATGYGKYYAAGMSLKRNPAVLWTVWRKVDTDWKIVSYILIDP